ncbi:energy-coupling factor transport system ATP-binding protein [Lactobacillus colini]|uniref:Energy-coupling factor transport system ATP-binding protein n=1 Tax=Lactobacillus colini TaxID=1819254 RepID=A0ABS4MC31_9LACO|nr:energy-coupling factor transporter ATPase [Lactobacillus colini]MBP2057233.1 energy-coupling factor transport system ATP-binding protein [Lactobacillus colini]
MSNDIIKINNISYTYPDTDNPALKNISLNIVQGSWTALIGHNGSGKSTLAKIIDGLIIPDNISNSSITIDGTVMSPENVWDIRNNVGVVFQNPDNQFVGATVEDDIAFGLENRNIPRDEIDTTIERVLTEVKMLEFRKKEPQTLSGGQKQRVALAGIFAINPKIIILDEATSMLDPEGRSQTLSIVKDLQKTQGLTVISITHDVDEVMLADQVIVLDDGQVVEKGVPSQIFNNEELVRRTQIGLPFIYRLRNALIQKGMQVPVEINTKEKLVKYLCQLNSKM